MIAFSFLKKYIIAFVSIAIIASLIAPVSAFAAPGINKELPYQGTLKTSAGANVSDGNYDMVFKIYDAASGGTTLWTGTHTSANGNAVSVASGLFRVLLGSGTGNTMTLDFNSDAYYLGLTIASDSEMTPRQRIGAAGYAINSDTVDGIGFSTSTLTVGDIFYADSSNTLQRLGVGSNGQVLKLSSGIPSWNTDIQSAALGSGLFATTTNNMIMYPVDTSNILVLGTNATTTIGNIFEVAGNSLFGGNIVTNGTGLFYGLLTAYNTITAPIFTATSTTLASTFPYASTTALTVNGSAYFNSSTTFNGVEYLYPTADGSNGQVLTTNSAGGLSWLTVAGGSGGLFATTTDGLTISPLANRILLVGANATTTTGNIFEVFGGSLFGGLLTAYNTITAPSFNATSTTATSNISGLLTVTGTSTLATTTLATATVTGHSIFTTASSTDQTLSGYLVVSGQTTLGNATSTQLTNSGLSWFVGTTTLGIVNVTDSVVLASTTPAITLNALYNLAGVLYWNGSDISTASTNNWTFATNYATTTLTATSTMPWWSQGALYASSTLNVSGLATFGNASSTQISVSGQSWFTGLATLGNASSTQFTNSGLSWFNATSTFASNIISNSGINIASSSPATTTQNLYALGPTLYWNGVEVGSGGSNEWTFAQNYGTTTLTATSTMPWWSQGALYASSTLQVAGLTILNNASTTLLTNSGLSWFTGTTTLGIANVTNSMVFDSNAPDVTTNALYNNAGALMWNGKAVSGGSAGVVWSAGTSATDNDWRSVTYGNGLFAAVSVSGTGNRVMTSPDGITWTSRTSATDNDWRSVTYGNGLFVVVASTGTGDRVMTSPDGITWTSRTSAADNDWFGVTYGNGLFVAVSYTGTGDRVMTSPDGITWTSRTSVADNNWRSVAYGNGLFVVVASTGTGDRVMTSPDGITWTSRTSAADNNWRSVAYGNGLFVAVAGSGTGDRVMTSPNGITWTSRTSAADNAWYGVTYGNGLFVAVSYDGTGNRVMTSPDGITWTSRTSAADNAWYGVTYGNGLFAAVSVSGTGNRVMTSGTFGTGGGGVAADSLNFTHFGDALVLDADTTIDSTVNTLTFNGGLLLASSTPATTTLALYNLGSTLFWNGTEVGSGSNEWTFATNYGATTLTATSTMPWWSQGAFYASSTLNVSGLATLGNASTTQLSVSEQSWFNATSTFASAISIGTTTLTSNILNVDGGIYLASTTPMATSSALYAQGSTLYWNGTEVGAALSGTEGQTITFNSNGAQFATSTLFLASSGNVGIGTTTPNTSAILDLSSADRGLLLPRVALTNTASSTPLAAHVEGMTVYNTATAGNVTPGLYVNTGTQWRAIVPSSGSIPTVTTATVTNVTQTTASAGGTVVTDGGAGLSARGVVWDTSPAPLISLTTKTNDGTAVSSYTSSVTGLTVGTTYYLRAYATNANGTAYGSDAVFSASSITMTTATTTSITANTATSGGNIINDGGQAITDRGVVWDTSTNPTTALGTKTSDGTGTGLFTSNITGLATSTTYYVRAYAVNSGGTGYGDEKTFTTPYLPTVTTSVIATIGVDNAVLGGNVTSAGGTTVTASGIVWNTSASPTVSSNLGITTDTVQSGAFTSTMTGLSVGTTYYVRAYATNVVGTTYGNQLVVIPTLSSSPQTLSYTGASQTYTVPAGVTSVQIDAYGAEGDFSGTIQRGQGGRARGVLTVTSGQVLNIYVGGQTGFNGGGSGIINSGEFFSGGGGTDVRVGGTALGNRVIVAGGGGGGSVLYTGGDGGGGTAVGSNFVGGQKGNGYGGSSVDGGTSGGVGASSEHGGGGGGGGLNSGGGYATATYSPGVSSGTGTLGQGGNAANIEISCGRSDQGVGGGGGGYYGGGGAAGGFCGGGIGGGGSSWTGTLTSPFFAGGVQSGNGQIIITTYINGADLAEKYPTNDSTLEAGEILSLDTENAGFVKRAEVGERIIGIVSTNPHTVMGEDSYPNEINTPVALVGRVPVKVTTENGDIEIGDRITISSVAGVGMKANPWNAGVGYALADYNSEGVGTIEVFINLDRETEQSITSFMSVDEEGNIIFTGNISAQSFNISAGENIEIQTTAPSTNIQNTIDLENLTVVNAEFTGNIIVRGHTTFGEDTVGQARILAGSASASVVFTKEYQYQPIVTITPRENFTGNYWVSDEGAEGFTINVDPTQTTDITFNWHAFATTNSTNTNSEVKPNPSIDTNTDIESPVITINSNNPAEIELNSTYNDLGATVTDNVNENLGIKTFLDGVEVNQIQLDTSTSTTYIITYKATDQAGNTGTAERTVIVGNSEVEPQDSDTATTTPEIIEPVEEEVIDTTVPIITLTGDETINLTVGDTYTEQGATAQDDTDGDITQNIITNNPIDTTTAGEYTVTYNVTDQAGNNAIEVTRIIIVTEPIIITPEPVTATTTATNTQEE